MDVQIRRAQATDVPSMVELSEQKRTQYQSYQPVFWSKATDSRQKQTPFFENMIARDNVIALVHEHGGSINGFVIAALVPSPPVYTAGITCAIDDYCVADGDWQDIGRALLDAVTIQAKERGAAQVVVVCGHLDEPKRDLLNLLGHTIASEWWVKPL